jgi:hypothetical protein
MLTVKSRFCDRVLSDNTAIVFDFNVQLIAWKDAPSKFQNFCQSVRPEPVFRIISDMCLQQSLFLSSGVATAIDETFYDVTDFG